jgi:hypothetical protein
MNSGNRWGSFPRWVGDTLAVFKAGKDAGAHMAALRVYLALALVADFDTREASLSWTALQERTGLSRPMVKKGIAAAGKAGLISIDTSGHRHAYHLLKESDDAIGFTQVPLFELRKALPYLPARGFHALDALKVYITLLTVKQRNSDRAVISHKKIQVRTGVQPGRIRSAIDVLVNHRLIHVQSAESDEGGGHPHNEYVLLGFSNRPPTGPAPTSVAVPVTEVTPHYSDFLAPPRKGPPPSDDMPF